MTEPRKYHPLVTQEAIEEARPHLARGTTDEEIAQLLSDAFSMLEGWSEPEIM